MYTSVLAVCLLMCVVVAIDPTTETTTSVIATSNVTTIKSTAVANITTVINKVDGSTATGAPKIDGSNTTVATNDTNTGNSANPLPVPAMYTMMSLVSAIIYGINAQF